ncbi:MAG: hypothetical protein LBM16_05435, partial [Clostridiales bacterium]|nr:hypothetical protein [Clostridiales bacterium]
MKTARFVKIAKSVISAAMAIVLTFSALPAVMPIVVFAVPPSGFTVRPDWYFEVEKDGPNNTHKLNRVEGDASNYSVTKPDVMLHWTVGNTNGRAEQHYLMKTVLKETQELYFWVSRRNTQELDPVLEVSYIIDDPTVPGIDLASQPPKPRIYVPESGNSDVDGYMEYDRFTDPLQSGVTDAYAAVIDGTNIKIPTFRIKYGESLRTQYDNDTVIQFKYENTDCYVTVNNISPDYIYDFSLAQLDSVPAPAGQFIKTDDLIKRGDAVINSDWNNQAFFTGFHPDYGNLTSDTFANITPKQPEATPSVSQTPGFLPDLIDQTEPTYPDTAMDKNGIRLTFTMPSRWNKTTSKFESISANPEAKNFMEATILLNRAEQNKQIRIDNMLRNGGTTPPSEDITLDYTVDAVKGVLLVSGLGKSELFRDVSLNVVPNRENNSEPPLTVGNPVDSYGYTVYTFIEYKKKYRDGFYYITLKPYAGLPGTYTIYSDNSESANNLLLNRGSMQVMLPAFGTETEMDVPIGMAKPTDSPEGTPSSGSLTEGETWYQVYFTPETQGITTSTDVVIKSQIVRLKPNPKEAPYTDPNDFIVSDVKLMPLEPRGTEEEKKQKDLSFTLQWDIGYAGDIIGWLKNLPKEKNMTETLTYDLYKTPSLIEGTGEQIAYDRVHITLSLDPNDNNKINASYTGESLDTNIGSAVIDNVIYDLAMTTGSNNPDKTKSGSRMIRANVNLKMRAGLVGYDGYGSPPPNKTVSPDPVMYFFYPSIYSLYIDPADDSLLNSKYYQITLDTKGQTDVPGAQSLRAIDPVTSTIGEAAATKDEVSFVSEFDIPVKALNEYLSNFPYESSSVRLYYNLYITESMTKLTEMSDSDGKNIRVDENGIINLTTNGFTVEYSDAIAETDPNTDPTVYFSPINGKTGISVDGQPARYYLRAENGSKIIAVKNIPVELGATSTFKIKLDGLDKNQQYYIVADGRLEFNQNYAENEVVDSYHTIKIMPLSNIATILTKTDLVKPTPNENVPGAPRPTWDSENTTSTTLPIFWAQVGSNIVDVNGDPVYQNDYEIIRSKDKMLPGSLIEQRNLSVGTLLDNVQNPNAEDPDVIVVKAKVDGTYNTKAEYYLQSKHEYVSLTEAGLGNDAFVIDPADGQVRFTDNTVIPNTLYYYYIRTVQTVRNDTSGIETYSVWIGLAATTRPVEGPVNLTVLREGVTYDLKTEMYIAFDAPIANLDRLGKDYDLFYSIRRNNEAWQQDVRMDATLLKSNAVKLTGDKDGYYHFIYKISKLYAGSLYTVRVRMYDNNVGDWSMYSNTAQTRTNLDQAEYDREKETSDWLEEIEEKLKELAKQPL